ncbi:ABC transporter ATP-binding protein [Ensifer aridi]|uniref:ABC transporter ATP-binding protein n=1 Tax=Ensifer aridi TaxID=1708715 RepID=UPI00041C12C7|nr:ATP-binding cassette domain-containing protein [Ensifer aridi]
MNMRAGIQELSISALAVESAAGRIVSDISFTISRGRPLTLLGESGSGKSLVAQAIMGNLPAELLATGKVLLDGTDLLAGSPAERRARWGRSISLLPQEPWLALDPTMRIASQVSEVHRFVKDRDARRSRQLAGDNLAEVGLERAGELYPFQMSGGMAQRAAIAITHAADVDLMIADEPTKGLDAALRDSVVARLRQEVDRGRLLLTITHDVAVARALGGTVGVMLDGRLVECGPAERLLAAPEHDYSRALIAADPQGWEGRAPTTSGEIVLAGRGLAKAYGERLLFADLDVEIRAGAIVAIVGPSGCGKTTVGNILLGLARPDSGTVERRKDLSPLRYQKLYQDPPAAFAPHQPIRKGLVDLVRLHGRTWIEVERLLARLRLQGNLLDRLPNQISGGELQRFAILRALLLDPVFLFADEATSRLDPLSQKEVIDFLLEIVRETGLAVLLVTHDRHLAERISSRIVDLGGAAPLGYGE